MDINEAKEFWEKFVQQQREDENRAFGGIDKYYIDLPSGWADEELYEFIIAFVKFIKKEV